jgi:hypothetical protein
MPLIRYHTTLAITKFIKTKVSQNEESSLIFYNAACIFLDKL